MWRGKGVGVGAVVGSGAGGVGKGCGRQVAGGQGRERERERVVLAGKRVDGQVGEEIVRRQVGGRGCSFFGGACGGEVWEGGWRCCGGALLAPERQGRVSVSVGVAGEGEVVKTAAWEQVVWSGVQGGSWAVGEAAWRAEASRMFGGGGGEVG